MMRKYTDEQIAFMREMYPGRNYVELAVLFNKRFGTCVPAKTLMSAAYNHGIKNGINMRFNKGNAPTQFKPGHVAWNKGLKGWCNGGRSAETRFKPGEAPFNYRPVGSERVDVDGYVWVKVADPNKWMMKHRVVWEAVHGPVPAGYVIIFADGDRLNVSLENLMLVSRRELAVLNKNHLLSCDPEFSRVGLAVARLMIRKADRERENREH